MKRHNEQITIKHGNWPSAPREEVALERVSLIGYVNLDYGVPPDYKFPLPLFTLDESLDTQEFRTGDRHIMRVQGLRPDHREPNVLVTGQWDAQVDIPSGAPNGEGIVYLGSAHTPSDAIGVIFDRMVPFDSESELTFVTNPTDDVATLAEDMFDEEVYKLVYTPSGLVRHMGRLPLQ